MSAPTDEELAAIAYQRAVLILLAHFDETANVSLEPEDVESAVAEIIEAVSIPLQAIAFRQAVQELWQLGQAWGQQLLDAVVEDGLVEPPDEDAWPQDIAPEDQAVG